MIGSIATVNVLDVRPTAIEGNDWTWHGSEYEIVRVIGRVKFVGGTLFFEVNNKANIVDGIFAGKVSNTGTIENGIFHKEVENIDGLILNGTFYNVVYNNGGTIKNLIAKNGFAVRANSNKNIEKITIIDNGVKLDGISFNKIDNIEIQKGAKVLLDAVSLEAAVAKTSGEGVFVIDGKAYQTDGSIVPERLLINDSFKLTKATQNAKEQKYLLDEKNEGNAQNDLQNDFKVDLLAVTGQNGGDILI